MIGRSPHQTLVRCLCSSSFRILNPVRSSQAGGAGKMKFEIAFTGTAAGHVRSYRKFDQRIILDAIDEQLSHEPTTET